MRTYCIAQRTLLGALWCLNGKEIQKRGAVYKHIYIFTHGWFTLLYSSNWHSSVKQLYSKKKKKVHVFRKNSADLHSQGVCVPWRLVRIRFFWGYLRESAGRRPAHQFKVTSLWTSHSGSLKQVGVPLATWCKSHTLCSSQSNKKGINPPGVLSDCTDAILQAMLKS